MPPSFLSMQRQHLFRGQSRESFLIVKLELLSILDGGRRGQNGNFMMYRAPVGNIRRTATKLTPPA